MEEDPIRIAVSMGKNTSTDDVTVWNHPGGSCLTPVLCVMVCVYDGVCVMVCVCDPSTSDNAQFVKAVRKLVQDYGCKLKICSEFKNRGDRWMQVRRWTH